MTGVQTCALPIWLYDENARRKTAAALARYGFGGDAVRRAMEAALSDQEDNGN